MTACLSKHFSTSSLADIDEALSRPPGAVASLEETFDGLGRGGGGAHGGEWDRGSYLVSAQEPGHHVSLEYVRLERGVWLVFGEFHFDAPIVQWHRQRRGLTFGVLLRGAAMLTTASSPQQRSVYSEGHVIGTACKDETSICRHVPPGVRCQGVSLFFDGDESLERFGLNPTEVRHWLTPQGSSATSSHATFQSAIGTPNGLVIKSAQSILWARFAGSTRRLYLRSKAGELMCHLLCTPAGAHSGIEFTSGGPKSDDSLAAVAHAALSDPEDCPEISELAERLQVSAGRLVVAFRSKYGVSPREHMTAIRMIRAKRLIQQTSTPLLDVAFACGYEHHSSFSTAYRRTFGQTPMETRRGMATAP